MKRLLVVMALICGTVGMAQADAVDALKAFVRDVKSGSAKFSQTVNSPDGKRSKVSSGTFETWDYPRDGRYLWVSLRNGCLESADDRPVRARRRPRPASATQ